MKGNDRRGKASTSEKGLNKLERQRQSASKRQEITQEMENANLRQRESRSKTSRKEGLFGGSSTD